MKKARLLYFGPDDKFIGSTVLTAVMRDFASPEDLRDVALSISEEFFLRTPEKLGHPREISATSTKSRLLNHDLELLGFVLITITN